MYARAHALQAIRPALAEGRTILTANQRAARSLRRDLALHHLSCGLSRWEPPAILAWDTWLATLWNQLLLDGRTTRLLLNRTQEASLWRSIIADDPETSGLRSPGSLAELAASAAATLGAYRSEARLRSAAVSADTRAFIRWHEAFEQRCRAGNLLASSQLARALRAAVPQLVLAPGYALVGFDRLTPAQEALLDAIRSRNVTVAAMPLTISSPALSLAVQATEEDELRTAAHWLRSRLEADPDARLALIVPHLDARRPEVDSVLRHILTPELDDLTTPEPPPLFEFSLGKTLHATPLIATALDLLAWAAAPLPLARVSQLLLSPHFAGSSEVAARAEFDSLHLRRARALRPQFSLEAVLRLAESSSHAARLPRLLAALRGLRRTVTAEGFNTPDTRAAADWADRIRKLLEAADWPGGPETSIAFQTRQKWEALLDEFSTLDFEGLRLSYSDALATLTDLARSTLFAPESRDAPVQVLGPNEAAGSVFDGIWCLGAGDATWPSASATSPLLSWQLQRELGVPGADSARDSAAAQHIAARIAASAPTVIFSYSERVTDSHQHPWPALAPLALDSFAADALPPAPQPLPLEVFDDSATLPPLPDRIIKGGAAILQSQAACGFRAFAEHRLWATAPGTIDTGLDARERGSASHVALEIFWKEVHSQEALKALTYEGRRTVLQGAIDEALRRTAPAPASAWDTAYLDADRERLLRLLDSWLLVELNRTVPFTIRLQETELKDASIGPLRLSLRVDRIDSTEFGDVILDYKTGRASVADWLTERPDAPQLPLYAVLSAATAEQAEPLAAVGFAILRPGKEMALTGHSRQKGILLKGGKDKDTTLEDHLSTWHEVLTVLATQFHEGDVRVRPKNYPNTCTFCGQRVLCRLDLSLLDAGLLEEDEPEGDTARG